MYFELLDIETRKKVLCYFCGTNKSVKYKVNLFDDPTIQDINERFCCNKCICFFIDETESEFEKILSNH